MSSQGSTSSVDSFIEAPQTTEVHSPTSSFPPSRSPRMANLLSALQGIIGADPQESTELSVSVDGELLCDTSDASRLPDAVKGTGAVHDENTKRVHEQGVDAPNLSESRNGVDVIGGVRDSTSETSNARDGGTPEDISSPSGLLSPVQIGTVPPLPFPHLGLDAVLACDDSIDSDSTEAWVGPIPFSLSPPHSSQPGSTLDLLSSPFGLPLSRVLPRRLSSSASWEQSNLPTLCDSIATVPPPPTIDSQHNIPSTDDISLMSASQAWHSPLYSLPPEQKRVRNALPSNGETNESDLYVDVSNSSLTDKHLVTIPSSDIPVFNKDSLYTQEEDLPIVHDETVGESQVPSRLSSTGIEANRPRDSLPHPTPTVDIKATPTHSASVSEHSPASLGTTAEVREFDYEALYQSLVMSPEEAASKHMSWASCSSPPKASSVDTFSLPGSTDVHADALRRSHSSVDLLHLRVAPALLSEYTSRTTSPLLETPVSPVSGSSQANAYIQSIQVCTSRSSLSMTGLVTSASPLTSSPLPTEKLPPQSPPIAGPSWDVKSSLNDRYEPEPARSVWNSVSTSRKVPFGFRNSITVR